MAQWVPPLLQTFLGSIIGDEIKQIATGHCIVQASRPRSVISPVLFGVGVTVDHLVGSKALVQMLARLGLSITVDEINKYKQSIVQSVEEDLSASSPAAFTQWSADNVDHNIVTLDGLGTFHGMRLISMSVDDSPLHTLPMVCYVLLHACTAMEKIVTMLHTHRLLNCVIVMTMMMMMVVVLMRFLLLMKQKLIRVPMNACPVTGEKLIRVGDNVNISLVLLWRN